MQAVSDDYKPSTLEDLRRRVAEVEIYHACLRVTCATVFERNKIEAIWVDGTWEEVPAYLFVMTGAKKRRVVK